MRLKTVLFPIGYLLTALVGYGQTPLHTHLNAAQSDTARLRIYQQIIDYYYQQSQKDSLRFYLKRALPLAIKYPKENLSKVYYLLGLYYRITNQYDSSLFYCKKALRLATHYQSLRQLPRFGYGIAVVYSDKGDMASAFKQLLENIKYCENVKDYTWLWPSYDLLSSISMEIGNKERAAYYEKKKKEAILKYGDLESKLVFLEELATEQEKAGDFRKAQITLDTAIMIAKQIKNPLLELITMTHVAENLLKQKQYNAAIKKARILQQKAYFHKLSIQIGKSYGILANAYLAQKQKKMALFNAQLSYEWALKSQRIDDILDSRQKLITAKQVNGQFESAFWLQKIQTISKDSMAVLKQASIIATLEAKQTLSQQKLREEVLKKNLRINHLVIKDLETQRRFYWFIVGIGLLVLGLISFFLYRTRQTQRAILAQKQKLEIQSVKLQEANQIKNKLFGVIGHDLRAPVQNFQTQLSLLEMDVISQEQFIKKLHTTKNNTQSLYQTLDNLLYWSLLQQQKLKPTPRELSLQEQVEQVLGLYVEIITKKELTIETMLTEDILLMDEAQLGIILRNIFHNAIKFSPISSEIKVEMDIQGQSLCLSVENKIAQKVTTQQGTGLGLELVAELMQLNGGNVQWNQPKNESFCVILQWGVS
jgi:signal transduction histidine kinase